jgi:hypothetical protein
MVMTVPQAVIVPVTMLVLLAFSGLLGLATTSAVQLVQKEQPLPPLEQQWTTDARSVGLSALTLGVLPSKPLPGQITTSGGCKWPGTMRRGACWVEVGSVSPPCEPPPGADGRLYADEGKCWAPVLRAQQPPTSGESRPLGVAEP